VRNGACALQAQASDYRRRDRLRPEGAEAHRRPAALSVGDRWLSAGGSSQNKGALGVWADGDYTGAHVLGSRRGPRHNRGRSGSSMDL
jgi:hypothetical protein